MLDLTSCFYLIQMYAVPKHLLLIETLLIQKYSWLDCVKDSANTKYTHTHIYVYNICIAAVYQTYLTFEGYWVARIFFKTHNSKYTAYGCGVVYNIQSQETKSFCFLSLYDV